MPLPRFIEVPFEVPLFDVKLGYIVEREANARAISLDELAVKCRRGAGYLQRISLGTAPFAQVHDIRRICEALDIKVSVFWAMVENVNVSEVRLARALKNRIVWAGGSLNPKNKPLPQPPASPTGGKPKARKLKAVK